MSRQGICCFVVLFAWGCGSESDGSSEPAGPGVGTFEALTYNVAGLPQGISSSDPLYNIPQISPMLNAYDLVLVQEDFSYHPELAAEAEHPYQSVPKEDYERFVNDGLNRFSQFPWTEFERVQWVDCYGDASTGAADCMAEKGFSVGYTELSKGIRVDVYNLHAEAGGGPEDVAARQAGIAQLIAYLNERSSGRAVIVGGDTNLHGDDPDDVPLLNALKEETGLSDSCEYLDCGADHIDRFYFMSGSGVDIEPESWQVADEFVDADGNDLSDHPAINVRFRWTRK